MEGSHGFLGALFDTSFTNFITTRLIKLLYVLSILMAAFVALGTIGAGFTQGFMAGLFALIVVGPLIFLLMVIQSRVWLELIIVAFRIAEHTATTARATAKLADIPVEASAAGPA